MTRQKGTIAKWIEERGFGFIQPDDTSRREDQIFMHVSSVDIPPGELRAGLQVEYDVEQGRKGLQARNVRLLGQALPEKGYRFLNPYNFVRYLPPHRATTDDDASTQLMGRTVPPPHDRWVGLSGSISCALEVMTPLFVSDTEGVQATSQNGHYSYRFFRIGDRKAIPASSLRGVIRSVFAAATNSCFANLGGEQLSYRLPSTEVQKLVPARVEKDGEGRWRLRLLPGRAPFAPDQGQKKGLYAAPARFYRALRPTGRRRQDPPPPIGDVEKWEHGEELFAVLLEVKFPPSWRALAIAKSRDEAEKLRAKMAPRYKGQVITQQGWFCRTNQNTDNKNSERFFFRDPGRRDVPETIPLPEKVARNYEALIDDYHRRHESDVKKRQRPDKVEGDKLAYSRFILKPEERRLRGGELVYARLRGQAPNLQVEFIAPVSWPRVAYERSIADLLPGHLRRCDSIQSLCPCCRTFGWVHGDGSEERESAYAGRVRFSHALLEGAGKEMTEPLTLAILGSPKPTTTRFYLVGPDGRPSDRPQDDITVGYDGRHGNNRLRGRKFYRHYFPKDGKPEQASPSDQNRTIREAEGPGARFAFTVEFENLAPVELGALLWALTLDNKGYHRLGYGKPLGMGSVQVSVKEVVLHDMIARYRSLAAEHWQKLLPAKEQMDLMTRFQEAMVRPYASAEIITYGEENGPAGWQAIFEQLPNIKDILTLLAKEGPALPVHYPRSPDPDSKGQFEWFVGNNRLNGPRLELNLTTEDEGLPLIDRQGNIH